MKHKTQIGIAPKTEETALRAVIFAVQDRWFALPVGAVLKVSLCPPIQNTLASGMGTIDLGNETATVINLEEKFAPDREYTLNRRYLILTQTHQGEKCGLVAESPPSMIEIPLSTIRPIPPSYRQEGELSFISHLAVLPKVGETETIDVFLLGVSPLLDRAANWSQQEIQKNNAAPQPSSQQQFMRLSLGTRHALLPVGCVVKAIPFAQQALFRPSTVTDALLGDYSWQGTTMQLLDLNVLLGYPSLLESQDPHKTLTVLIIQRQQHYVGLLVKAVRQLEWRDLQALQPINNHSFLQGKFDEETFLLNLSAIKPWSS